MGLVPTLTQLGYALGILLLAPLGDRFDRRRIILAKAAALVLALLLAAGAPSIGLLLVASLADRHQPRRWRRTSCPPPPRWRPRRTAARWSAR